MQFSKFITEFGSGALDDELTAALAEVADGGELSKRDPNQPQIPGTEDPTEATT